MQREQTVADEPDEPDSASQAARLGAGSSVVAVRLPSDTAAPVAASQTEPRSRSLSRRRSGHSPARRPPGPASSVHVTDVNCFLDPMTLVFRDAALEAEFCAFAFDEDFWQHSVMIGLFGMSSTFIAVGRQHSPAAALMALTALSNTIFAIWARRAVHLAHKHWLWDDIRVRWRRTCLFSTFVYACRVAAQNCPLASPLACSPPLALQGCLAHHGQPGQPYQLDRPPDVIDADAVSLPSGPGSGQATTESHVLAPLQSYGVVAGIHMLFYLLVAMHFQLDTCLVAADRAGINCIIVVITVLNG